jgi:predicted small secreted protein
MKKTIAAVLVVFLLAASLVGCYNPPVVMNVNGMDIPSGIYLFSQLQAVSEASELSGGAYPGDALYRQMINDLPARDWISNRTIEIVRQYAFVEQEFVSRGLSEEKLESQLAMYQSTMTSEWSQIGAFYETNGIGHDTFVTRYRNYIKSGILFDALYIDEGAPHKPPDDEIIDYFVANYSYMDYIKIAFTDESGNPLGEEAIESVKATAEQMKNAANAAIAGAPVIYADEKSIGLEAAYDLLAESEGLTDEQREEQHSRTVITNVIVTSDSTSFDSGLLEAFFASDYNAFNTYSTDNEVYVYCNRSIHESDGEKWHDYSATITSTLKNDEYTIYLAEQSSALPYTESTRAKKYFSIDKVKTL